MINSEQWQKIGDNSYKYEDGNYTYICLYEYLHYNLTVYVDGNVKWKYEQRFGDYSVMENEILDGVLESKVKEKMKFDYESKIAKMAEEINKLESEYEKFSSVVGT